MAKLRISGLTKRYGGFVAVDDIDMDIDEGEFVFLLGPSGCGKTTTLRMIAGLEMPSAGRISLGTRNVTYLRARYRNVGMVFQDYGLYRHMTVYENIAYPLKVRKMSKAEIAQKVGDVSDLMQISDVLSRKPDQLSAGQLQRVAISRMLVRDADIFLMDEPMSHLDAQLRGQMRAELRHLQKTIGVTTIFVTHDQLEAMTMADRILVMRDGKMLQFGTPREIFERPDNEFVATFVGEPHMNVVDAALAAVGDRLVARLEDVDIPLDANWVAENRLSERAGTQVKLGIRPEHITVSEMHDQVHPLPGSDGIRTDRTENLYVFVAKGVEVNTRSSTEETRHLSKEPGSRFWLGLDPSWIYLFDPQDGHTIAFAPASSTASVRQPTMRRVEYEGAEL
jgi:multiple sugar transport system ATP-binding protein